jgi:hypothetical protein
MAEGVDGLTRDKTRTPGKHRCRPTSELEHVIRLVGRSPSCYTRRVTLGKLLSVINRHKGKDIRLASALRIFVAPDALRRAVPQEHREAGARLSVGLGAQPRPSPNYRGDMRVYVLAGADAGLRCRCQRRPEGRS